MYEGPWTSERRGVCVLAPPRLTLAVCTSLPLSQAANYLDIKGLLDVTCKTVANMIKGKTPEEIRKTFNIKNDFTEEEEAQVSVSSAFRNLQF